jgi:hypothetical protein
VTKQITIDYQINGHINSQEARGRGRGLIDLASGVNELEVDFEKMPTSWDPRTIVLMCCDRILAMGSRGLEGAVGLFEASGGYVSIGRHIANDFRRAKILDPEDNVLVDVAASSMTDLRGPNPTDESRIEGGISRLQPGVNGIARIISVTGLMQQASARMITLATRYEVELEDGMIVTGHTYYPHFLPEPAVALPGPQQWRMEQVRQEFDGRRLWTQTVSSVAPLVEVLGTPERERISSGSVRA